MKFKRYNSESDEYEIIDTQTLLDKIGDFGDGLLEFETSEIEGLIKITERLRSLLGECLKWFEINRHSWNCLRNVGDGSDSDFCNCEAPELREKIENELKKEG